MIFLCVGNNSDRNSIKCKIIDKINNLVRYNTEDETDNGYDIYTIGTYEEEDDEIIEVGGTYLIYLDDLKNKGIDSIEMV